MTVGNVSGVLTDAGAISAYYHMWSSAGCAHLDVANVPDVLTVLAQELEAGIQVLRRYTDNHADATVEGAIHFLICKHALLL